MDVFYRGDPVPRAQWPADAETCGNCNGTGEVRQRLRPKYQAFRRCHTCAGRGYGPASAQAAENTEERGT